MGRCVDYIKNQLSVEKIVLDAFQFRQYSEFTLKENSNYWLSQRIPFNSVMRENLNNIQILDLVKENNLNFDNRRNPVQINNIQKIQIFK
jgi:hypothetical protein